MPVRPSRLQLSLLLLLAGFTLPARLWADGGIVQFQRRTGSLVVTLFSSPSPLRTGPADLSVLLESVGGNEPVLDATVDLALRQGATRLTTEATHTQATNKLLYAALPDLPSSGKWQVTVSVMKGGLRSEVSGTIEVLPGPPAFLFYWPYFAIVPLLIGLFVLNQRLKKKANF